MLAGTFWRIFGSPQEGLQCYKWALSTVPKQYEDVVLTNLAGLFYKSGSFINGSIIYNFLAVI